MLFIFSISRSVTRATWEEREPMRGKPWKKASNATKRLSPKATLSIIIKIESLKSAECGRFEDPEDCSLGPKGSK